MARVPAVHVWSSPDFKDQKDALIKELKISSIDAKKSWKDLSDSKKKIIEDGYHGVHMEPIDGKIKITKVPTDIRKSLLKKVG